MSPGAGPGSVGGGRGRSDPSRGAPRRPRASFAAAQRGAVDARGSGAATPREPRKCLLRAGWRRDDRAGRERRTEASTHHLRVCSLDVPRGPALVPSGARRRRRCVLHGACASAESRFGSGCDIGSYKNLLQRLRLPSKKNVRFGGVRAFFFSFRRAKTKRLAETTKSRRRVRRNFGYVSPVREFVRPFQIHFTDSRDCLLCEKEIFGRNRSRMRKITQTRA